MRKINKANRFKFVKAATEKILALGAILQEKKYDSQEHQEFVLDGLNPITFRLTAQDDHVYCYTVTARFEKPIKNVTNPVGKYNFHENGPLDDPRGVLDLLDYYLDKGRTYTQR